MFLGDTIYKQPVTAIGEIWSDLLPGNTGCGHTVDQDNLRLYAMSGIYDTKSISEGTNLLAVLRPHKPVPDPTMQELRVITCSHSPSCLGELPLRRCRVGPNAGLPFSNKSSGYNCRRREPTGRASIEGSTGMGNEEDMILCKILTTREQREWTLLEVFAGRALRRWSR